MSILIHGMEMPKSCAFCRFCEGLADTPNGTCAFCAVDGKQRDAQTNDGCPLVPVPDHGRLIDADFLLAEYDKIHVGKPGGARLLIANAPTIIPAEEGDNG